MKQILCTFVLSIFYTLHGQELTVPKDPRWETIPAEVRAKVHLLDKQIKIYNPLVPMYWILDLDGDGLPDYVLALKGKEETDSAPAEMGLWIYLSSKPKPIILGCGFNQKLWGDSVFDQWRIFRRWQPIGRNESQKAPRPKGDYLLLEREGVEGVMVYWDGLKLKLFNQRG